MKRKNDTALKQPPPPKKRSNLQLIDPTPPTFYFFFFSIFFPKDIALFISYIIYFLLKPPAFYPILFTFRNSYQLIKHVATRSPVRPFGIAIGEFNNIFISDRVSNSILIFSYYGDFIKSFGVFNEPRGIAIDKNFNIIIADYKNCKLAIFDRKLKQLNPIQLNRSPVCVAFANNGNLIVSFKNEVLIHSKNGCYKYLPFPNITLGGIAVDNQDNIFIVQTSSRTIAVYDYQGIILRNIPWVNFNPSFIAVDKEGNIIVSNPSFFGIMKGNGQPISSLVRWNESSDPIGSIAFDNQGGLVIAGSGTTAISFFSINQS